jgi:hypothetical protein
MRLVCIPSTDLSFRGAVEEAVRGSVATTADLERALRPQYPDVRARSRELSGEIGITWYVYRERSFPAHIDDSWPTRSRWKAS